MELIKMYGELGISEKVLNYGREIEKSLHDRFEAIDKTAEYNQLKVIKAMQEARVSDIHFAGTTGYGYNDLGRDTLEEVYAKAFHGEDALVRPQLISGTHALTIALSGNLRPGDEILSPVGKPYDTLEEVIGIRDSVGSLKEFGITYSQVDLLPNGDFDFENIKKAINERTKLIEIQRSKGYATRPTLSVKRIGELISFIKSIKPDVICMVDNCYGEFVEEMEPTDVGADMIVGSLIKNPGGGLAPIGGYIVGRRDCVERAAYRLTAPGLGKEVGASLGVSQSLYQGLFLSPTVVAGALKGAIFAANVYEKLGFGVVPNGTESRHDIIQAITFGTPEGRHQVLRGHPGGSAGGQLRDSGAVGDAGIRFRCHHGSRSVRSGVLNRTFRRRSDQAAVRGILPGRTHMVSCEARYLNVPSEVSGCRDRDTVRV